MGFFWPSRVQNNLVWELVIRILGPLRSKWMGNFWPSRVHFVLLFSLQTVMLFYVWLSLSCICDFNILALIQCSIISTIVQVTLRTFYPLFEHWDIDHNQMRNFAKSAKNAWNVFVRNSSSSNYRVDGNSNLSSTINKQNSVLNFNPLESRFLAISTALDLRTWTVKGVSDKSEMHMQLQSIN